MKCNVGKTDRTLRFIGWTIVAAAGIYFKSWWGLVAIQPLATATFAWCPFFVPFNISTVKKDSK